MAMAGHPKPVADPTLTITLTRVSLTLTLTLTQTLAPNY